MNQIPWGTAAAVFLGTLPLLGAVLWNLMDIKGFRSEFNQFRSEVRTELKAIQTEITAIRERLATLEERDRLTHPVLVK
jgi:hypothetical protein